MFYDRDALDVARELIGCHLAHAGVVLRIMEVEARVGALRLAFDEAASSCDVRDG